MLESETKFPFAGSFAIDKITGARVRIIQTNADGTFVVSGFDSNARRPITRTVGLAGLINPTQRRTPAKQVHA